MSTSVHLLRALMYKGLLLTLIELVLKLDYKW